MNKCVFIGNLTRDPELSTTGSGKSVCNFCIAVSRTYNKEEADFINVVTWGERAKNCAKYLKKGRKVCVVGRLEMQSYTDKENVKRTSTKIQADEVEFLGGNTRDESAPLPEAPPPKKYWSELQPVDDDDLPF